ARRATPSGGVPSGSSPARQARIAPRSLVSTAANCLESASGVLGTVAWGVCAAGVASVEADGATLSLPAPQANNAPTPVVATVRHTTLRTRTRDIIARGALAARLTRPVPGERLALPAVAGFADQPYRTRRRIGLRPNRLI